MSLLTDTQIVARRCCADAGPSLLRHTLDLSLSRLDERLDPERFVRVHRAHIVNLGDVRAFNRDAGRNFGAELSDGRRVPVSRRRAQELRSLGL